MNPDAAVVFNKTELAKAGRLYGKRVLNHSRDSLALLGIFNELKTRGSAEDHRSLAKKCFL
jgi:hypothetical protein